MNNALLLCLLAVFPAVLPAQEEPLRFDGLLRQALERNPKIQAAGLEAEASSFRIPQDKSLPDPMVGFSLKNMGIPEFTLGREAMSGIGLSFSQAIPFPGKLRLKGEIAEKAFERKKEVRDAVVLGVLKDVKIAYFEFYGLQKTITVLQEQKALLEKARELTETKASVGRGTQSDVLKNMVEISRMDEMILPMKEMITSFQARINLLLDFPPDRPLGDPQEPGVAGLPLSLEDLRMAAKANSPIIKEASLMIEENGKMVALARKERAPNFVIEGGWEYKGRLPSMYEVMIGVEVPLYYRTKQAKMLEESLTRLRSSKSGLASQKNDVTFMVTEDYLKARAAESLIKLYKEKILPQASLTVESSLTSYSVDKTDFLALLSDISTYFGYRAAYYRELVDLWSSIARLEESTATEIVAWGENDEVKN